MNKIAATVQAARLTFRPRVKKQQYHNQLRQNAYGAMAELGNKFAEQAAQGEDPDQLLRNIVDAYRRHGLLNNLAAQFTAAGESRTVDDLAAELLERIEGAEGLGS